MTLGVTFVGQPVQKASAQVLIGAGSGDIITLADFFRSDDTRYVVTGNIPNITEFAFGSSGQETAFIAPDSDLDINSLPPELRWRVKIVNSFNTKIALTYNVPGFDGRLTNAQVCSLIRGDITDWNQITGDIDSLPVIRVVSGGVSANSQIVQRLLFGSGGGCHNAWEISNLLSEARFFLITGEKTRLFLIVTHRLCEGRGRRIGSDRIGGVSAYYPVIGLTGCLRSAGQCFMQGLGVEGRFGGAFAPTNYQGEDWVLRGGLGVRSSLQS